MLLGHEYMHFQRLYGLLRTSLHKRCVGKERSPGGSVRSHLWNLRNHATMTGFVLKLVSMAYKKQVWNNTFSALCKKVASRPS